MNFKIFLLLNCFLLGLFFQQNLYAEDISDLINKVENKLFNLKKEVSEKSTRISQLQINIEALQKELRLNNDNNSNLEAQLESKVKELTKINGDLKDKNALIHQLKIHVEELEYQISTEVEEKRKLKSVIDDLEAMEEELSFHIKKSNSTIEELKEEKKFNVKVIETLVGKVGNKRGKWRVKFSGGLNRIFNENWEAIENFELKTDVQGHLVYETNDGNQEFQTEIPFMLESVIGAYREVHMLNTPLTDIYRELGLVGGDGNQYKPHYFFSLHHFFNSFMSFGVEIGSGKYTHSALVTRERPTNNHLVFHEAIIEETSVFNIGIETSLNALPKKPGDLILTVGIGNHYPLKVGIESAFKIANLGNSVIWKFLLEAKYYRWIDKDIFVLNYRDGIKEYDERDNVINKGAANYYNRQWNIQNRIYGTVGFAFDIK